MSTPTSDYQKPQVAPSGMDHDALPAGTRFGEFEIKRVVGVGGFGIVYLAHDHSLEREVALKEYMPASLAARGQGPQITVRSSSFAETYAIGLRSFVNEARLLARFDHPSLVKVYRFWEDNATAYMVMPFLQGTTLRDTRRAMPHPPDEAWIRSVITPLLSALELLHREGVYHRDIAPDNILLPDDGPPVLLDFGAARRVISDRTQSLTAILKPSYAPIEQYAEMTQLRQGPWTDLYALGAVVHYLLFGAPPAPATARAVQDEGDGVEHRIVPGVSPRFLEAVSWMLSIRPNHRPQSGEQLRAVLDGHAVIPPRGRPGITIPGALPPAAPAFEATRHVSPSSPAAGLDSAIVPTHLPTARVLPPGPPLPTNFSPAREMPTPRVPAADPATTAPSMRRTSSPAGSTVPPLPPITRPPQPASRPATLPPPVVKAQATLPPRPRAQPTQPASLAAMPAAADKPASSKTGLMVAGGVALAAIVAVAGWQALAGRGAAPSIDPSLAAASAASPAPSAVVATAAPSTPVTSALPGPSIVAPVIEVAPVPTTVAAPAAMAPTAMAPTALSPTAASSSAFAAARPAASGQPVPSPADSRLTPAERAAQAERLAAAASAASNAKGRLAGKPVPRADGDPAGTTFNGPGGRTADGGLGSPPYGAPGTTAADRARAAAAATNANAQREVAVARPAPPVYEAEPTSAREACGKRVFIALAVCLDEKCEEARFRNTPECIGILSRKTQRENR